MQQNVLSTMYWFHRANAKEEMSFPSTERGQLNNRQDHNYFQSFASARASTKQKLRINHPRL